MTALSDSEPPLKSTISTLTPAFSYSPSDCAGIVARYHRHEPPPPRRVILDCASARPLDNKSTANVAASRRNKVGMMSSVFCTRPLPTGQFGRDDRPELRGCLEPAVDGRRPPDQK